MLVAAVGVVLMVVGVIVGLRPLATGFYSWTAYAPLSEETFSPGVTVLDHLGVAALVVAAAGLALLAGAVGYALGSRRRPPPPADGT